METDAQVRWREFVESEKGTHGGFCVHHPACFVQFAQQGLERAVFGKGCFAPVIFQASRLPHLFERGQELAPEQGGHDPDGNKKTFLGGLPTAVGQHPAPRHDTVDVRVKVQFLHPSDLRRPLALPPAKVLYGGQVGQARCLQELYETESAPQPVQASRCPPSAALRQLRMVLRPESMSPMRSRVCTVSVETMKIVRAMEWGCAKSPDRKFIAELYFDSHKIL